MLGVVAFSMSMVGTFLVRSGILTSVHAFAVDPERGSFILALLAIYIGGALALFALRAGDGQRGRALCRDQPRGRAGGQQRRCLSAILGIVLVGTLYPLLAEAFGREGFGRPALFQPGRRDLRAADAAGAWRSGRCCAGGGTGWRGCGRPLAIAGAGWCWRCWCGWHARRSRCCRCSGWRWRRAGGGQPAAAARARSAPHVRCRVWGMVHRAFRRRGGAVRDGGDSAFTRSGWSRRELGETVAVGPWQVALDVSSRSPGRTGPRSRPNCAARYAGRQADRAAPAGAQLLVAAAADQRKSRCSTRWNGQLYAVLGEEAEDGRWQLRLWWKPFVT